MNKSREQLIDEITNEVNLSNSMRPFKVTFPEKSALEGNRFIIRSNIDDIDICIYDVKSNQEIPLDRKSKRTDLEEFKDGGGVMVKYTFFHDNQEHLLVMFIITGIEKRFFFHMSHVDSHTHPHGVESSTSPEFIGHNSGPGGGRD